MTALDGLTAPQRAAATYTDGPALVVAGPGAGKTRTLVARLAYLIESGAARPEELLAVTFTRKAAAELRSRLTAQLGAAARAISVGTFHAVALLLRPLPTVGRETVLFGEADRYALSQKVVANFRQGAPRTVATAADRLVESVSRLKGQSCDWPTRLADAALPDWLRQSIPAYQEALRELGAEDLDDLLIAATAAVSSGTAQRRYRFVQVDEYQDINGVQREFLCAFYATGARLFAIGDPDQAIYSFRGAEVAHFHAFADDFSATRRFFLRENFRATANLVNAANAVIEKNADRIAGPPMQAAREAGEPLTLNAASSPLAEAIGVAREIERLIGGTSLSSHDQGRAAASVAGRYGFSDIAVLTRTAARADQIAEALGREGVPILRPRRARPSTTDTATPAALHPRLRDWLGLASSGEPAPKAKTAGEVADEVAGEVAPELAALGLAHESDEWDERLQRVAVLTLHGAKGLEFPVVFLCGCEEDLLPGKWREAASEIAAETTYETGPGITYEAAPETINRISEERRLFYVGLTRAKDLLYLSHASFDSRPRSPFLDELPQSLLFLPPAKKRKPRPPQLKLF